MAFDRLITKIAQTQNPTVAGLDHFINIHE